MEPAAAAHPATLLVSVLSMLIIMYVHMYTPRKYKSFEYTFPFP